MIHLLTDRGAKFVVATVSFFLATIVAPQNGFGFTERNIETVFSILDSEHTGKVNRAEYDHNKVAALFPAMKLGDVAIGHYRFEETPFNRAFFNRADQDHKGVLDVIDLFYAFQFEAIDVDRKGYITIADLRRFMHEIGR